MIFKGIRFRRSTRVVELPNFDFATGARYPHSVEGREDYVVFGRLVDPEKRTENCVRTLYKNKTTDEWLYAEPIPVKAHSLTNMMYGEDGRAYLLKDGVCYTAPRMVKNN